MKILFLSFILCLLSISAFAQTDQLVNKSDGTEYHRTKADGDCSNNYSAAGNVNPYTGKSGTVPCAETTKLETSAPGTGEYFLVPPIVRNDPKGTAIRFNTCGTALMALMDKETIYNLTDKSKQYFTPEVVLGVAESRFRMAVEYVPDNYLYHLNLGVVLYRQRRLTEALDEINRAIKLNPNSETAKDYQDQILHEKTTVRIIEENISNP